MSLLSTVSVCLILLRNVAAQGDVCGFVDSDTDVSAYTSLLKMLFKNQKRNPENKPNLWLGWGYQAYGINSNGTVYGVGGKYQDWNGDRYLAQYGVKTKFGPMIPCYEVHYTQLNPNNIVTVYTMDPSPTIKLAIWIGVTRSKTV